MLIAGRVAKCGIRTLANEQIDTQRLTGMIVTEEQLR
jgi:hypothetical protein